MSDAFTAALLRRKERLAQICGAYPETLAVSVGTHEHLSLEVAGKRFGYYLYQHFGDDGRSGAVLKAANSRYVPGSVSLDWTDALKEPGF